MLGYASPAGVGWSLITNGDDYRLYNASAPVPAEEKLFRNVRVSEADLADRCLEMFSLIAKEQISKPNLDALWQSQFVDRRVEVALESLFASEDLALAKFVRRQSPELSLAEVRESLRRAQIQVHFPAAAPPMRAVARTDRQPFDTGRRRPSANPARGDHEPGRATGDNGSQQRGLNGWRSR